jgi:6-phosphogluconolactonase
LNVEVLPDAEAAARRAATLIAEAARDGVARRGRFLLATSGGATPGALLRLLAGEEVPWPAVQLFQVDERVAPEGHPDRNLTGLRLNLLDRVAQPLGAVHAMPVELPDLAQAAAAYARTLRQVAGAPPVLDLVHLGLGADGHTASLLPGDPSSVAPDDDVAATGAYQGHRRLTLTLPTLNRARRILWVVTGEEKGRALARLLLEDRSVPAGLVRRDRALVVCDAAAHAGGGHGPEGASSTRISLVRRNQGM